MKFFPFGWPSTSWSTPCSCRSQKIQLCQCSREAPPMCGIWFLVRGVGVIWARALLRVRAQLFAHVNAHICHFILQLSTNGEVFSFARRGLILDCCRRGETKCDNSRLHCNNNYAKMQSNPAKTELCNLHAKDDTSHFSYTRLPTSLDPRGVLEGLMHKPIMTRDTVDNP